MIYFSCKKRAKDRKNPKYCYSVDFQTKFDMNYTDSRNNPMSIVFPKERYKLQLLNQQHGLGRSSGLSRLAHLVGLKGALIPYSLQLMVP